MTLLQLLNLPKPKISFNLSDTEDFSTDNSVKAKTDNEINSFTKITL